MSNKPKKERRLVPYVKTPKEKYYTTLCQIVEGKKGTTKKMSTLKGWAKAPDPSWRNRKTNKQSLFENLLSRIIPAFIN